MQEIVHLLSWILLVTGGFLGITGGVGILRFPDFYTRLHAAGVTDTLCAGFILIGLMLQAGLSLVTVKLMFVLLFLTLTSPTATHALAKAALHGKLNPRFAAAPGGTDKSVKKRTKTEKSRSTTSEKKGARPSQT